jgi:hypothetical protein
MEDTFNEATGMSRNRRYPVFQNSKTTAADNPGEIDK